VRFQAQKENTMTTASIAAGHRVTENHRRQFDQRGYFVLDGVLDEATLTMLREECAYFLGYMDARMEAAGKQTDGLNTRRRRYFVSNYYRRSTRMHRFIFSELMAEVCRATLGDDVYLFHEQWVVKGAEQGMKFAWHQDSGYVGVPHKPYLTCWVTLDDVSEDNGTVYLLPYDRAGTRDAVEHSRMEGGNDLVGYFGDDPGDPVIAPAGSIACFSSTVFHRSGANTSPNMRRIYLPQYATEQIVKADGTPRALTTPFLKAGVRVYDPVADGAGV
jgi:ectoine hydroxylase-related dioxygenase (phytanoyl-CoA dioxygenase family)